MINLIKRNTPAIADLFVLKDIEKENGKGVYKIYCENGKIVLAGDCKISQAMAYYRYLKDYCKVNFSNCGNTKINVETAPLPNEEISFVIEQEKRLYMNYRTFAYSAAFWDWERWEKEIDFMAMNGINMPLSIVGSEAVWYYTLRDLGYSEVGALRYLSGPAFWPYQLTGNFDSYFALADVKYVEARLALGQKILNREVELGMSPIMPGFDGRVPGSIVKLFRKTKMRMIKSWRSFKVSYMIDPLDPLFKKFGSALLEKQKQLLGAYHYYSCDPFFENEAPSKSRKFLWDVGRMINRLYEDFDAQSVWVVQSKGLDRNLISAVPKERLLVIDLEGNAYKETDNFYGYDFILGSVHNRCDRTVLHGDIKSLAENPYLKVKKVAPNVVGTGIFAEGINQNPLYFELALDMLTSGTEIDLDKWLDSYAERRYASDEDCLKTAVRCLAESCYSPDCTGSETGSVICARPATELRHTAPGDTLELRYDNKILLDAAEQLMSAEKADSDGWRYDICDIMRQVLSNHASAQFFRAWNGYKEKNLNDFERGSNGFLRLCEEIDELLQTRPEFTLHHHLKQASAQAIAEKDQENFELNVLAQVTVWGPFVKSVNYDMAWREWGGLIATFYVKRWQTFFEQLALEFPRRKIYSNATRKQPDGRNEYTGNYFYKNYEKFEKNWLSTANPDEPSNEDTVEKAKELAAKYHNAINGITVNFE